MSDKLLQKAVLYIKDVQEISLFRIMSDPKLFLAFSGTPLYFMMLPCLGLIFVTLALIRGYQFAKASNKNWDQWLGLSVSAVCASLTGVSLFGGTLATAYGASFAAGPWLFFSSIALASIHQMVMLGIDAYRAYESPKNSSQRMHYIQALWGHLFNLGLCLSIVATVSFVMLFPIAPIVGTVFALSSVAFTGLGLLWRMIPYEWKQTIKGFLGLDKPKDTEFIGIDKRPNQNIDSLQVAAMNKQHVRIFTRHDYRAEIKNMSFNEGEAYLLGLIEKKISALSSASPQMHEKNDQKICVLNQVREALKERLPLIRDLCLKQFPLAFQNFWSETGEVEQLFEAHYVVLRCFKWTEQQVALQDIAATHTHYAR